MRNNSSSRLYLLAGVFVLVGLMLVGKLFFIQIVAGAEYREAAERQYRQSLGRTFNRGSIFLSSKDGTLVSGATLTTGYILAINPPLLTEPQMVYDQLHQVLPNLDQEQFQLKSQRRNDPYEEVAARLDESAAAGIRALKLPGVEIIEENYRSYPGQELAAQVLGFMGYQGNIYAGRYGLEKQYEEILRRQGEVTFSTFLAELLSGSIGGGRAASGVSGDLITTIEPKVQQFLESELETVMTKWQGRAAGGIILEPRTGAVLALAARPAFDPGEKQGDLSVLLNPLVERVYEMGSIVKPLTLAAGLDAGAVNEDTYYTDLGSVIISDKVISNYDGRARGRVPLQEILNQSLNTGAVFVMQQLGQERFRHYFDAFGLGQKTGIDLPGEVRGLVSNLETGSEVEYATAAFGQGLAVTPLNITMALSTLANGGQLLRPRVVERIRYTTGVSEELPPPPGRQVIKVETARRLTTMLVKVVDEALDGGRARLPHYQVAAKTGTAQIPRPDGQGYETDKFLHSFFGYFPATAPRFSVFLYTLEPTGALYASQTLTEPFSQLAKFLLNYYQVPPDR
ncbi:MAG: penicillin-binding protein 2 [Candidatus Vogelbacteria bacterium]|nr:penicillin-binding protein 2 [Candidatus Vogelbacteria bacterium]